jgi:transposase
LTERQGKQLGDLIDSGPVAYGLESGVWTSPMIAWVIAEEFGVHYHPGHVRKLLHSLGYSVQRPRRRLARANAWEQDRWHRHTYPNLKKKPTGKTGR